MSSPYKKFSKDALVKFLDFEIHNPSPGQLDLLQSYERLAKQERLGRELDANFAAFKKTKSPRKMSKLTGDFGRLMKRQARLMKERRNDDISSRD
jgi:hypothetical protein